MAVVFTSLFAVVVGFSVLVAWFRLDFWLELSFASSSSEPLLPAYPIENNVKRYNSMVYFIVISYFASTIGFCLNRFVF